MQSSEAEYVRLQIRTGASGSLYFGLPVTSILNSVVTLTVDAGSLTLVQNVAPGKVVSAQASLFSKPPAVLSDVSSPLKIYTVRAGDLWSKGSFPAHRNVHGHGHINLIFPYLRTDST